MKKDMGANHKVNSPKISQNFPRWWWGSIGWVNQAQKRFQIDPKCFQKVATELKKKNYWKFLLTRQWLRLWAWFFRYSMLLQPERCLLPCRYTYNTFFMDLPGSPFVSHSSLLPTKGVHFVVGTWWLQFQTEIVHNFHRLRFSTLFTPQ